MSVMSRNEASNPCDEPMLVSSYKHLTPGDVEHFLSKGWLRVPGAIKSSYIDEWMKDLWTRVGYDEFDKSTWEDEYLHLPRHREVPAEEFAPEAWNKIVEICGGEDRIDPVRERYYGDAFIINFGSKDKESQVRNFRPQEQRGWHTDDDWYRMFLDSAGNALTVIHVFTDIPAEGGGTCICEDGLEGKRKPVSVHRYAPAMLIIADIQGWSSISMTILRVWIPPSMEQIANTSRTANNSPPLLHKKETLSFYMAFSPM